MTANWNWICTRIGDAMFGWTLSLPRDLTILFVGIILAILLLAVRRLTTNQSLLRQITADQRRLSELGRDARAANDHENLSRCNLVRRLVAHRRARAEWLAVCSSILLLTAVMSWGQVRLDYLPIAVAEPVQLVARFPAATIGEHVHLVPAENVSVVGGWVRIVEAAIESGVPSGKAEWTVQFGSPAQAEAMVIRLRNQTAIHRLVVGTPRYENPIQQHDGAIQTEVLLTPYQPLGVLPARLWPGIPGWSLLLTIITGALFWLGVRG